MIGQTNYLILVSDKWSDQALVIELSLHSTVYSVSEKQSSRLGPKQFLTSQIPSNVAFLRTTFRICFLYVVSFPHFEAQQPPPPRPPEKVEIHA